MMNDRSPNQAAIEIHEALPARCRPDLLFKRRSTRRGGLWTAKDPVSLKYFQLREEELFVLRRLDGATTPATIQSEFARRFAPQRLDPAELLRFVQRMIQQGLVITDQPIPLTQSLARRKKRLQRARWARLSNPLVLRFRGVDPQKMLDRLYPAVRWLLSAPVLFACALTMLAALLLIGSQWDTFQYRMPAASRILAPANLAWLVLAIGIVKVLHEFGHAFVCRHFGGECRELGLMLLAFTPCLYCNVSDAWLLPDKWHRIAVSAAGIGVELTLAAVCTFLWWFSEPGAFHSLCLSIMIVTSVGTVLLNGNPLLRYDGYYILSDLLDVPNLRSRALNALRRCSARLLFGVREPDDALLPRAWTGPLILYGAASTIYLWVVIVAILAFVYQALKPVGLQPVALLLALLVIGGRLVAASVSTTRRVSGWHSAGLIRPIRFGIGCLILTACVSVLLLTPFPFRIHAPCVVTTRNMHSVFITVPGYPLLDRQAPHLQYGKPVSEGDPILRLVNHELELDVLRLQGERDRQARVVESLRRRQFNDPDAAAQLPSAMAAFTDFDQRWQQRLDDCERLVVRAPSTGVLLPSIIADRQHSEELQRQGRPLDERNRDAFFDTGTLVGMVGDPRRFDAVLVVDQADIPCVQEGQIVRVRLAQMSPQVASGIVTEIAARPLQVAPTPLVLSEKLPTRIDGDGRPRPVRAVFEVRVALDEDAGPLVAGAVGDARIVAGKMTLANRLLRVLQTTFVVER